MKKSYIIVIVLILLAGLAYFVMSSKKLEAPTSDTGMENVDGGGSSPSEVSGGIEAGVDLGVGTGAVKEFTVSAKNFSFSPSTMTVKKGDKVKITFKNVEGNHDFKIDEFNVGSKLLKGGEQDTVEFVADKTGSFQYYCSVGTHRAMGMWGTLKVE